MTSIGETLRRERLRLNLDLERVARETKINIKLLEAIEAEDFSKLPGGVFTKSFVRQYARLLGIDEDEIAGELQRQLQPAASPSEASEPPQAEPEIDLPRVPDWAGTKPPRSSSLPALALVVVVMLVCSAVYAWWQKSRQRPNYAAEPQVTMPANAPAPQKPETAPPQAAQQQQQPAPGSAGTAGQALPAAETQAVPAAPAATPPAPGTPAAILPNPAANVHVLLTATEPTWISVRSDGKVVYTGTLQANEKKDLDAVGALRMVVGNAGGLAITLNGQPVPPIGPRGQVRIVQLSPGGVQIVPRKPPDDAL